MVGEIELKFIEDIERNGFSLLWILGDGDGPGFGYSVGLSISARHPDLLVVGLPQDVALDVLDEAARQVVGGVELSVGDRVQEILEDFDVLIGPVEPRFATVDMRQAAAIGGKLYQGARQILWPDSNGLFPHESGFDPKFLGEQEPC